MKIDFQGINQRLLASSESYVRQWLPGGKTVGHEYQPLNPTRSDKSPGSLTINLRTGKWSDFATGDKGGDLISLYAYIKGIRNGQAAAELSRETGTYVAPPPQSAKTATPSELTICLPVPADAPFLPPALKIGGRFLKPSVVYPYTDATGTVLRYICRFNAGENGLDKKEFRPLTCWRDKSGKITWRCKDIPDNAVVRVRGISPKP